jgi:hypothetical protein
MNFIEQGDTAFATLFLYDAQRRPRWFSASHLTAVGTQGAGLTWSGSLKNRRDRTSAHRSMRRP